jgi:CRP/FNR family nitrogen fixation transcriptional regulator
MSIGTKVFTPAASGRVPDMGGLVAFLGTNGFSGEVENRDEGRVSGFPTAGSMLEFERNQAIFSDGESARSFYKVIDGSVRLCKLFADGRRQIAGFCFPGEYFGLACQGKEYALTAEAMIDTTVVRFSHSCLADLDRSSAEFRSHLVALLCGELSLAQNHLLMLGRQTVKERIASFLLMMLDRRGRDRRDGVMLDLHMGRQDIADYLGLTIETVCRTISDFKRAGILGVPGPREIVVKNIRLLQDTANGEV